MAVICKEFDKIFKENSSGIYFRRLSNFNFINGEATLIKAND